MSRGPGAKGAARESKKKESEEKKRKTKSKEKEEKKRENETFQILGRGPRPIYPHESK